MTLMLRMDLHKGEASRGATSQSEQTSSAGWASSQQTPSAEALRTRMKSTIASDLTRDNQPRIQSPPKRADTPCPTKLKVDRKKASYVLLPDERRQFIKLGAGTTAVGRCKSTGIRDYHVSRRHVEITVPEEGPKGSKKDCCRIKYVGRNCRVVLVGGILLKPGQEVPAGPGTRVILNFNNKGLPSYSYTLVPASQLPALARRIAANRRARTITAPRWRRTVLRSPHLCLERNEMEEREDENVFRQRQEMLKQMQPLRQSLITMKEKHRTWRFRKEAQDKLQKEREEIINKFADLKF